LERSGIDNHILTYKRINEKDRPFKKIKEIQYPGRWNIEKETRKVIKLLQRKEALDCRWPQIRRRIRKALIKIQPDIIHAHMGDHGVIIGKVASEMGIPFIVSFHGYDAFRLPQNEFWGLQYKNMDTLCAGITCVSNYMKEHLANYFDASKIEIIHVGKNLDEYSYKKPDHRIERWISIGRLTHKKGHEDTIKAFHRVLKKHPNQRLKIIGGGKLEKQLLDLINELNISNEVTLTGAIPHSEVKQEFKQADAFILSSKTADNGDKEGIPTVLMEAQAIGLPCVSTKHSGIPEVFPQENQFLLAEEGNIEDIYQKIGQLIHLSTSEVQKISKRARDKINQEFNLKRETKKLIKLYQVTSIKI
jgi:glycosyltransferase involved in cell wall biosynthesis